MPTLREVVERNDIPAGRRFDFFVQGVILASLVAFSVETLPDLSPGVQNFLSGFEYATVALFSAEYVLRVAVADRKRDYTLSFYGLVDIAAIAPSLLGILFGVGVDLRALRSLRLLRVFRALKLMRYSLAIKRFQRALVIVREELVLFLSASLLLIYLSGVGIYYFERGRQPELFASVFDGLWWAVISLTTVGYGDVYPETAGGRVFTFVVLMIGLGMVAVPTGLLATALAKARDEERATKGTSD